MKIKCCYPDCRNTQSVSLGTWIIFSLYMLSTKWYVCPKHRCDSGADWEVIHKEREVDGYLVITSSIQRKKEADHD